MLPVGRRYTTTVRKSLVKTLTCEHCRKEYQRVVVESAQSYDDSILWLDNKGAEERSARSANRNCDKRLAKAVPMAPCTHCGWHQKRVVNIGRFWRFFWTALAGVPAGLAASFYVAWSMNVFVGFVILGIVWAIIYNPNRRRNAA